jgi:hypothetical protein
MISMPIRFGIDKPHPTLYHETKGHTMKRIIYLLLLFAGLAEAQSPRNFTRTQDVYRAQALDVSPVRFYNGEPLTLSLTMQRNGANWTNASGNIAAWVWSGADTTVQYLFATSSIVGATTYLSAPTTATAFPVSTQGWTWVEIWQSPTTSATNLLGVAWRAKMETLDRWPPTLAFVWTNAPVGPRQDALTNEAAIRAAFDATCITNGGATINGDRKSTRLNSSHNTR